MSVRSGGVLVWGRGHRVTTSYEGFPTVLSVQPRLSPVPWDLHNSSKACTLLRFWSQHWLVAISLFTLGTGFQLHFLPLYVVYTSHLGSSPLSLFLFLCTLISLSAPTLSFPLSPSVLRSHKHNTYMYTQSTSFGQSPLIHFYTIRLHV